MSGPDLDRAIQYSDNNKRDKSSRLERALVSSRHEVGYDRDGVRHIGV
jgi:hypothetical protein